MTITPGCVMPLEHLQAALRSAHARRVCGLRVEPHAGGVEISGEAVSYYAIQLVMRDVLAAGVRHCRNCIRVRPAVTHPTSGGAS